MADTRTWQEGIIPLWPTLFVQRRLDDARAHNDALFALVRTMESGRQDLTTDYRSENLFESEDAHVRWLKGEVDASVIGYLKAIGIDYPINWTVQGWANINRFTDYHDAHNHPFSYLSGTYWVRMPRGEEKLPGRSDRRASCISFYDPRGPAVNMTAIQGDPYVDPEYTIRPEPGMLMLWPAFVSHFVHPNLSKDVRVSISFNIVLKWQDHYMPKQ